MDTVLAVIFLAIGLWFVGRIASQHHSELDRMTPAERREHDEEARELQIW